MPLMHCKNVVLRPDGRGVLVIIAGADVLEDGALDESAIVLLYPSRESAKEEAR